MSAESSWGVVLTAGDRGFDRVRGCAVEKQEVTNEAGLRQWSRCLGGLWSVVSGGQWSVVNGQRIVPPSAAPSRPVNSGPGGPGFCRCSCLRYVAATQSVAVHTLVPRARWSAWPERLRPCHWRLTMAGFPGMVLIPLGRLQPSPIPLLARGALLFHRAHPPTGGIDGTSKRRTERIKKAQEAGQAQEVAGEVACCSRPRLVGGSQRR